MPKAIWNGTVIAETEKFELIEEKDLGPEASHPDARGLRAYLAGEISLGKAADLLGLSRFELQDRFLRLGVPLHLGSATLS